MAKRQIVQLENPVLREISKPITEFDDRLHSLIDDMKETMHDANGLGLAAPQVGILKRVVIVCDKNDDVIELINPKITHTKGSSVASEGCLSIKGRSGDVARPRRLIVEAQDRFGKRFVLRVTDALTCVVICHEVDHLDGILYIDKLVDVSPKLK